MTDRTYRATVLVQAADPGPGACDVVTAALEAMPEIVEIVPTIGAYDAVATVQSPTPRGIGPTVVRIQADETVGRTLTLTHREEIDR